MINLILCSLERRLFHEHILYMLSLVIFIGIACEGSVKAVDELLFVLFVCAPSVF